MKLAVRRTYFGDRLCFPDVIPHSLLDVQAAYARKLEVGGSHRDDAIARSRLEIPGSLPALLQADPDLTAVRRVHGWAVAHANSGDLIEGCTWPYDKAFLGPPIGAPRTIWGMLVNYARPRRDPGSSPGTEGGSSPGTEGGSSPGTEGGPGPGTEGGPGPGTEGGPGSPTPRGFLKAPSSLAGPYDNLLYPDISQQVQPEMELGVVIGRRSRHLDHASAMKAVAGYVAFCDVGARDISSLDNQRMDRGKGFDTFAIVGPWFVTADEISDPHRLRIRQWVNGELRQDASSGEMLHSIPDQLCWLTAALTLAPGDLLSTGTPAGVRSVVPGDEIRGEIDGLGVIENMVVREKAQRRT